MLWRPGATIAGRTTVGRTTISTATARMWCTIFTFLTLTICLTSPSDFTRGLFRITGAWAAWGCLSLIGERSLDSATALPCSRFGSRRLGRRPFLPTSPALLGTPRVVASPGRYRPAELRPRQLGFRYRSPLEVGPAEVGAPAVVFSENSFGQDGAGEVGIRQDRTD